MRVAVALTLAFASSASPDVQINFRGSGQVTRAEIVASEEAIEHDDRGVVQFQKDLSKMFKSLPKNAHGKIEHEVVRYAMQRYFLNRHGWYIRGLEPGNATYLPERNWNGELPPAFIEEWALRFLQETLEHHLGNDGVDLHGLGAMSATIEDLVRKEVHTRLRKIYNVHSVPTTGQVKPATANGILTTYYMTFLLANNLTAKDTAALFRKKKAFEKKYRKYAEAREWFDELMAERFADYDDEADNVDFETVVNFAHDIGERYHTFNDKECNNLRNALSTMETKRSGRVRLSVFYNSTRFTHWRFRESAGYLQRMGALDTSDPKQPSVITSNYVMMRDNCLEASNLYAICCRDPCEALMSHLEHEIGRSTGEASDIAALVEELPSQWTASPRTLSPSLVQHLDEIATLHDGQVPLHGRLFGQWMHHAFPRECQYPHEGGVGRQSLEDWLGDAGNSVQTSDEERKKQVESDVCSVGVDGKIECGDEDLELPWSPVEELMTPIVVVHHQVQQPVEEEPHDAVLLALGVFILVGSVVSLAHALGGAHVIARAPFRRLLAGVLVLAIITMAFQNMLDREFFALAACLSFVVYMVNLAVTAIRSLKQEKSLA